MTAAALALAGCSVLQGGLDDRTDVASVLERARHIEIEVDNPNSGLPCRVVDRLGTGDRDVLWYAEFEEGFCHRKAEETRIVLRARGWACRPLNLEDQEAAAGTITPRVIASWRCLEGLEPRETLIQRTVNSPPLPAVRPDVAPEPDQPLPSERDLLDTAVERDLTAIGQDIIGNNVDVRSALGDLNGDGIDDAAVVLTRGVDRELPHRMLMAYLRDGEDYNLVDVWILRPPTDPETGELTVAIEDGQVRLGDCCAGQDGPVAIVLNNRKLAYADGS